MEFLLLGPLEVREDGRGIPIGGAKQRALLALLLLHANEVVSRDRLIGELWGERPPGYGGAQPRPSDVAAPQVARADPICSSRGRAAMC